MAMNPLEMLRIAFTAVRTNKLRSFLTMLGVIIGVGSVVIMVAIMQGFKANIMKSFEALGSSSIVIFHDPDEQTRRQRGRGNIEGLRLEDAEAIRRECSLIAGLSCEMDIGGQTLAYKGNSRATTVRGVQPEYLRMHQAEIGRGRWFEQADLDTWSPTVVLGERLAARLFEREDPLGKDMSVGGTRFTVVGVLARKGRSAMGGPGGENLDEDAMVPLSSLHKRLIGTDRIGVIIAQPASPARLREAMDQVWATLMRRHNNRPDFTVDSVSKVMDTLGGILAVMTMVVGGIAGLSLLVGGIGIMNIMLVSVTERTKEIGLRKAVGAKSRHVLVQFLTEAMTLSGLGGLMGVGLGYIVAFTIASTAGDKLPASVPFWAASLGFGFSVLVGVIAGVYPAFRAARMDPIQALRYE